MKTFKEIEAWRNGQMMDVLFDRGNWGVGHHITPQPVTVNGVTDFKLVSQPGLVNVSVVNDDASLAEAKATSFKTIFDTWKRIALIGNNPSMPPYQDTQVGANQGSMIDELTSWQYDAANDRAISTINSTTVVGFISPGKYDNYTFEVELSSSSGDDDGIGLCVGYKEINGKAYALMLFRAGGSNAIPEGSYQVGPVKPLTLIYQAKIGPLYPQPGPYVNDPESYSVAGVTGKLVFPDGIPIPAAGITTNGLNGGWDLLGPIRLKVVRTPTSITCYSANKGSTTYDAANSFTVNLNSDPRLAKFMEPCSIGYIAYSQPEATFKAIQQPGLKLPIIDQRDNSLWLWSGTAWVKNTMTAANRPYKPGQIVRSAVNGKSFVANNGNALIQMGKFTPE